MQCGHTFMLRANEEHEHSVPSLEPLSSTGSMQSMLISGWFQPAKPARFINDTDIII